MRAATSDTVDAAQESADPASEADGRDADQGDLQEVAEKERFEGGPEHVGRPADQPGLQRQPRRTAEVKRREAGHAGGHGPQNPPEQRTAPRVSHDPARDGGGDRKGHQVTAGRTAEVGHAAAQREHRKARHPEREVGELTGGSEHRPEQQAGQEDGDGLQGERHRGARERHAQACAEDGESRESRHGDRPARPQVRARDNRGGGRDPRRVMLVGCAHILSTLSATALPPPRHRVASPVSASRSRMA
jgi:hypothetical protein